MKDTQNSEHSEFRFCHVQSEKPLSQINILVQDLTVEIQESHVYNEKRGISHRNIGLA